MGWLDRLGQMLGGGSQTETDRRVDETAEALDMRRVGHELVGVRHDVGVGAQRIDRGWRVYGRLRPPLDLGLFLYPRESSPPGSSSGRRFRAAHAGLNMAYFLEADDPARGWALFPVPVGTELLRRFEAGSNLLISDQGVSVQVSDHDHRPLASLVDAVAELTAVLNQQRRYAPLASHYDAWTRYAADNGLRAIAAPLGLWGSIAGADVEAYSIRLGQGRLGLEVLLRFHQPLDIALDVRPKRALDQLIELFGSEEVTFDDPRFDPLFVCRAADAHQGQRLLDQQSRDLLASMLERSGSVSVSDDGVAVQKPTVPTDPSAVLSIVDEIVQLAHHLDARRRAALSAGVYR